MREKRFRRLLDAYGADPAHWPEDERAAALHRMVEDPASAAAVDEAGRLDALLARMPAAPETTGIELPATLPPQHHPLLRRLIRARRGVIGALWPQVATLALASVVGVLIGLSAVGDRVAGGQDTTTVTSAFGSTPTGGWQL